MAITDLKQYRNHYTILANWVSLCPFYQQLHSPVEKNRKYTKFPSNYRKTQQKHQVDNFVKKYCSFFYMHFEELERKYRENVPIKSIFRVSY